MTATAEPAARPAPARRRRRWPWVLGILALLGLFGGWWIARQLEPERLAATVLDRAGIALGLEFSIDGMPEYALRPEPRLVLPGLVARMPGAATPLLTAERVEVSLPWSTITGDTGTLVITRIELDAPVLDLAALSAWLDSRPDSGEPFELPTLTEGLEINDGRIVGDGWSVDSLALDLPELAPGAPAVATIAAKFAQSEQHAEIEAKLTLERAGPVTPLRLEAKGEVATGVQRLPFAATLSGDLDASGDVVRLSTLALRSDGRMQAEGTDAAWKLRIDGDVTLADGDVTLQPLALALDGDGSLPDLRGSGSVHLGETRRIEFAGELTQWPETWPALPPPLVASGAPLAFRIGYDGAADFSAPLTLSVARDETKLHSTLVVPDVLAWLDADDAGLLPPLQGELTTPRLQVGGFVLEGVQLRIVDDEAPAGTATDVENDDAASDDTATDPR